MRPLNVPYKCDINGDCTQIVPLEFNDMKLIHVKPIGDQVRRMTIKSNQFTEKFKGKVELELELIYEYKYYGEISMKIIIKTEDGKDESQMKQFISWY